jgi:hypothetical protein
MEAACCGPKWLSSPTFLIGAAPALSNIAMRLYNCQAHLRRNSHLCAAVFVSQRTVSGRSPSLTFSGGNREETH